MLQEQQVRQAIFNYTKILCRAEHLAKITGLEEKCYRYFIDHIAFSNEIDYRFEYKYEHDYEYESLPLRYLWMDDDDVIADFKAEQERKLAEEKALKEEEERKKKEAKERLTAHCMRNSKQSMKTNDKLKEYSEFRKSFKNTIFSFDEPGCISYKPYREHYKIENGYYKTIMCGLSGIYTVLNKYKDGHWMLRTLDDSEVIAYRELYDSEKDTLNRLLAEFENN